MTWGEKFTMRMGIGGKKEAPVKKQEGGEVAPSCKLQLDAHTLQECRQAIEDESSYHHARGEKNEHRINYLSGLPNIVQKMIEKRAHDIVEGRIVAKHSEEWAKAIAQAFDEALPQWRNWLPETWQKPPQEKRRRQ